MNEFKPQRLARRHEISTQEDLDFCIAWIRSALEIDRSIQGKVNAQAIAFTDKFLAIDQQGVISIEKVVRG